MKHNKLPLLSIVVPVYNEEENIDNLYDVILKVMDNLKAVCCFEIFFTNNCSTDNTWNVISKLAEKDDRIKGISYSRNFGYQRSIYMGYLECNGDMAIQLDCDLQDDPCLIPQFIAKWQEGYKVVYGIRKSRKESKSLQLIRKIYYRFVNQIAEDFLPPDVGEFRLIDRVIIEELRKLNDHQPYLRGIIATMGYRQYGIEYGRNERLYGTSKFGSKQLFKVAFDGIFNHSIVPLRVSFYFGMFVSIIVVMLSIVYITLRIFFNHNIPAGFTTITLFVLFGMALNAIFLGIIGEYVGRIYRQVKNNPIAIIEKKI